MKMKTIQGTTSMGYPRFNFNLKLEIPERKPLFKEGDIVYESNRFIGIFAYEIIKVFDNKTYYSYLCASRITEYSNTPYISLGTFKQSDLVPAYMMEIKGFEIIDKDSHLNALKKWESEMRKKMLNDLINR